MKQATLILILFGLVTSQFFLYQNNAYSMFDISKMSQEEFSEMEEDAKKCLLQTGESSSFSVCNPIEVKSKIYKDLNGQCCKYETNYEGYPNTYLEGHHLEMCTMAAPGVDVYSSAAYFQTRTNNKQYMSSGSVTITITCGNSSPVTYKPENFTKSTDEDKANDNYYTCFFESSYFTNDDTVDFKKACKEASSKLTPEKYNIKCTYFYEASYPNEGICLGIPGNFDLGEVEYILRQNQIYYDGVDNQYISYSRDGKETTGTYTLGSATPKQPTPGGSGNSESTDSGSHLKTTMLALFLGVILL